MAGFRLEVPRAALVITDPQENIDALWSTDEALRQI